MRRHGIPDTAKPALFAVVTFMSPMLAGPAAALAQSDEQVFKALREQIVRCYAAPQVRNAPAVTLRLRFGRDGSLDGPPVVVERSNSPEFQLAAEHALRAVRRCRPSLPSDIGADPARYRDVRVRIQPR